MFSYNHFQKNKLKYVIVCIFLILILVLIRCYCNNKERFSNKEGFVNKMITDVLLGKKFDNKEANRVNLSDNIKESGKNQLNIIFSTYYIQPKGGVGDGTKNDSDDFIDIFLRTKVGDTTKIIGDLFYKIDENKLGFDNNNHMILNNENVPHLLNPILNNDNALELTESDIKIIKNKDTSDKMDIIKKYYDYNIKMDYTTLLLNLIGINTIKDIYFDDNMKKIYNFFTKGKTDSDFLGKNDTQILNNLTYENNTNDDLFKIIKNVKYIEELRVYYNDIENETSNIEQQVAIILSNKLKNIIGKEELNGSGFVKRIYAGYNISDIDDFIMPFTMNDDDGEDVPIDNSNKFKFINNVLKKLKYNKQNKNTEIDILIDSYEIFIDEIILFKDTILETTFYIPYLQTSSDYNADSEEITGPESLTINSDSLISTLEQNYSVLEDTNPTKLNDKVTDFKDNLNYILNEPDFF